jgi:nucleoside-diphosphate-sugar epimerase/predicted lipid carrier protein YhbT
LFFHPYGYTLLGATKFLNNDKTIFITGATGLVGGLLALRALADGYRLRLLARDRTGLTAETRIFHLFLLLGVAEEEWVVMRDRIEVVHGDVTKPRLGLTRKEWQQAAENLQALFHAAAYTGFDKTQAEKSVEVNLYGTRNVLKFVEQAKARYFHISTAYIVGDTRDRIFEKPQYGPFRWKNPYEKTKCIAEGEVHDYCRQNGLNYAVFRPAILIGDSQSGCTIRFNNIYDFIKVAHTISRRRSRDPVIIEANASARLNMVPVDFAVNAIWDLSESKESAGRIFHITNPSPPSFIQLVEEYSRILDLNIQCVNPRNGKNPGILVKGRRIGVTFREYGEYMFGEPEFDLTESRSLLPDYDDRFPRLDENYFRTILEFAVAHKWGSRQQVPVPVAAHVASSQRSYTERYFNDFLADKLDKQLIRNLKNLSGKVAIHLRDQEGPDWLLELKNGMLTAISQNSLIPECTYLTTTAIFESVARGKSRPEEVFFAGDADIQGDIEKGLHVITALSEFFRSFPFNPESELVTQKD